MNIKIKHIEGRWVVIVSTLSGEFREDVTDQIKNHIFSEAWHMKEVMRDASNEEMRNAINKCIEILSATT